MRKYTVIAVLGFAPGAVLGLTDKQAELRKHALKPLGNGVYEVVERIEFKVGEVIATDAEPNKVLITSLEPSDTTETSADALVTQTKAALFDTMPEAQRAAAVNKVEASIKADDKASKK